MDAAFMLFKRHESGIHAVRIHLRVPTASHASTLTAQQHQQHRRRRLARPWCSRPSTRRRRFHDRGQFWPHYEPKLPTITAPPGSGRRKSAWSAQRSRASMRTSLLSAVGECVEALRSAIPRIIARDLRWSPTRRGVATRTGNPSYVRGAASHDRSDRLLRPQFQLARRKPVLSGLPLVRPGRTGLIGVNGSGKSTLLKLIAGELRPGDGIVRARGEVGYLPQAITLGTRRTVSDLLGITGARAALHAIEAGDTGEEAFAASATTGMSRSAPAPGWTAWAWRTSASTTGWSGSLAARPSWPRWPRCSCGDRTSCCSTSRPTTWTWTRGSGCTTRSRPGPG